MGISRAPELFHFSYGIKAKTPVISPSLGQQIALFQSRVHNRSGGALDLGILRKLAPESWSFYKIAASTTDLTDSIQAGDSIDIFESTNHGFIVSSEKIFHLAGLTVSVGEAGSPVYTFSYWNGSTWSSLPTINVPSAYDAGTVLHVWSAPIDWVKGSDEVGVSDAQYAIRVLSTTAPSSAVTIDEAWAAIFIAFQEGVADNGYLQVKLAAEKPIVFESKEGLLPYFGNSENAANVVEGYYSISG